MQMKETSKKTITMVKKNYERINANERRKTANNNNGE